MKRLVFEEVLILSKTEKAARRETFDPNINLLLGENDVGKSTLIKSLYHTLGADVPGVQNAKWRNARPVYCVRISLAGRRYLIIRDEKYFGVFDASNNLIGKYSGISGARGIAKFINPLLDFRIELERAEDGSLGIAGPAFYFLPFYVDQDEGWTKSWASFGGLQQFSAYRKHMLEYHLGVRPQAYYDAKKTSVELTEKKTELETERATIVAIRDSYQKKKSARQVELDPSVFRREVEELIEQYNKVYVRQQEALQGLKDIQNERHSLESEIAILQRAIRELDDDYVYAEDPETPELIACPTCGTEIENSIRERFGILDDIDYCYALVDQRRKKIVDVVEDERAAEEKYRHVSAELAPVDDLLRRKRHNVTFSEFVSSEGMKDVMSSMSEDINGLLAREDEINKGLAALSEDLKVDAQRKKEINQFYQARMKEFLSSLRVDVLAMSDYKTFEKQIKVNALGSDLPRSLLAQHFSFLYTMDKFNPAVICPLLLDSPFQQEQDPDNIGAIFRFIFSRTLSQQQLILSTLTVDNAPDGVLRSNAKIIRLSEKLHLLEKSQYDDVMDRIGALHEETLAAE
jgi:AAA15 family ATPase/GTPase